MDYDWDERWEPGYDAGPEQDCDCEECGAAVFDHELRDDGCVNCTEEAGHDVDGRGYDEDYLIDGVGFADPGGRSALRAATPDNPRVHPCPTCGTQNVLTPADVARGYQCNRCADRAERGGW